VFDVGPLQLQYQLIWYSPVCILEQPEAPTEFIEFLESSNKVAAAGAGIIGAADAATTAGMVAAADGVRHSRPAASRSSSSNSSMCRTLMLCLLLLMQLLLTFLLLLLPLMLLCHVFARLQSRYTQFKSVKCSANVLQPT
jgi:hypothetical protein